jgi:hypothetical protein
MQNQDFYSGFDTNNKNGPAQYLVNYQGTIAEELIAASITRNVTHDSPEWHKIKDEGNVIYRALADCVDHALEPRADEVQTLIKKHVLMLGRTHKVSKDVYMAYAQLYCENTEFRKFFDPHYPKLPEFIAEAMRVYALKNLS